MPSNSFSNRLYNILSANIFSLVYIPLILYWFTLFVFTTIPTNEMPQFFNAQDKLEHFLAYFFLTLLLTLAIHFQSKFRQLSGRPFITAVILIFIYATADELHQLFIPGRFCDLYDWLADILGGMIGIGTIYLFLKKRVSVGAEIISQ